MLHNFLKKNRVFYTWRQNSIHYFNKPFDDLFVTYHIKAKEELKLVKPVVFPQNININMLFICQNSYIH